MTKNSTSPAGPDRTDSKPIAAASAKPADRVAGPIEQAVVLRDSLRDTLAKTNQLIHCLKQQKRQSKLVAETLASLKQLQAAG